MVHCHCTYETIDDFELTGSNNRGDSRGASSPSRGMEPPEPGSESAAGESGEQDDRGASEVAADA